MVKLRYLLLFIVSVFYSAFADEKRIYYYVAEKHIDNYKTLKVSFDGYLKEFGNYKFQAFNDKAMFERFLSQDNSIVILSSGHYAKIAKRYDLQAKLVAWKKEKNTCTKVLIGKKDQDVKGMIATAYPKEFADHSLSKLVNTKNLNFLKVPKDIDALMSVGFGMSRFAYVSKDSFELLKKINGFLADSLAVYKQSLPYLRMLVASNDKYCSDKELREIFTNMNQTEKGKKILKLFRIDDIAALDRNGLDILKKMKEGINDE